MTKVSVHMLHDWCRKQTKREDIKDDKSRMKTNGR